MTKLTLNVFLQRNTLTILQNWSEGHHVLLVATFRADQDVATIQMNSIIGRIHYLVTFIELTFAGSLPHILKAIHVSCL